jgi:hypothetical protein
MTNYILKERVLNDDYLMIADSGKVFKGGYVAILVSYSYQNEWSDSKRIKQFRNENSLNKFIAKKYPEFQF